MATAILILMIVLILIEFFNCLCLIGIFACADKFEKTFHKLLEMVVEKLTEKKND